MSGWTGKLLRVNLTQERWQESEEGDGAGSWFGPWGDKVEERHRDAVAEVR